MTGSTSNVGSKSQSSGSLLKKLAILVSTAWFLLILWAIGVSKTDPFVKSTLNIEGSLERGERLFKINCAGCHGITGQGLLGPTLQEVSYRLTDAELIHQVIEGKTPPMPSFQVKPETMADLLEYLHTVN